MAVSLFIITISTHTSLVVLNGTLQQEILMPITTLQIIINCICSLFALTWPKSVLK